LIFPAKNTGADLEDLFRQFIEECYQHGLAISEISEILGIEWASIGQIIREGLHSGSLPKIQPHQRSLKQYDGIFRDLVASLATVGKGMIEESPEDQRKILSLMLCQLSA